MFNVDCVCRRILFPSLNEFTSTYYSSVYLIRCTAFNLVHYYLNICTTVEEISDRVESWQLQLKLLLLFELPINLPISEVGCFATVIISQHEHKTAYRWRHFPNLKFKFMNEFTCGSNYRRHRHLPMPTASNAIHSFILLCDRFCSERIEGQRPILINLLSIHIIIQVKKKIHRK